MTVNELIAELQKFDGNKEVVVKYICDAIIGYNCCITDWIYTYDEPMVDESEIFSGSKVVMIHW